MSWYKKQRKTNSKQGKRLQVNKQTNNCFVQCRSSVNRDAVRRETIDGVEHIIVSSFTLPDNVVMNGMLYPAEEIETSFKTLERTLAPVEHPVDTNGNFISANDPIALHNFHAGAFNMNVVRVNGRVHIEKHINVVEANKTERGKRLLDRIEELETNDKARPIHTSTGVFLIAEQTDKPMTNHAGDEYTLIARSMVFDHDAILLNSIAAATPDKGVGMAVNKDGEQCETQQFDLDQEAIKPKAIDHRVNQEGDSFQSIMDGVTDALKGAVSYDYLWIVDLFDDEAIFETENGFFTVPYRVDDGEVRIVGIPIRVERVVTYVPKVNQTGNHAMKDLILNLLKEAKVEGVDEMTEAQLLDAYNQLQANQAAASSEEEESSGAAAAPSTDAIGEAVANAIKPLTDQVTALQTTVNAREDDEKTALVKTVVNSGKFPGLDDEAAAMLSLDKLQKMAANCGKAYGLPITHNDEGGDSKFAAPSEMPE